MLAKLEESIDRYLAARHNRARQVTSATNSPAGYKSRRWLEVMREGQLTRDPVLRTRSERRASRRRACELARQRELRFGRAASPQAAALSK